MQVREESLNHRILLSVDYISRLCHWSHKRLSGPARNSCFLLFRREAKESYVKLELLERQPAAKETVKTGAGQELEELEMENSTVRESKEK